MQWQRVNSLAATIIVRDGKGAQTGVDLLCSTVQVRMRLFVALAITEEIRHRIVTFVNEVRGLAPNVRWMHPEALHITLKFIGDRPDSMVGDVEASLKEISSKAFQLSFRGAGFFPTEKSARVFWIGIDAGPDLPQLAAQIEQCLGPLGIEPEQRAFSPHLTLARAGSGSGAPGRQTGDKPNRRFSAVAAKLATMPAPDFGTMNINEFFLYRSQLSSTGARYTKIARFPLNQP
jgi:2'-5' RNA ligase